MNRDSLQFKIIVNLAEMKFTYSVALIFIEGRNRYSEGIDSIKKINKELKENFLKYREEPSQTLKKEEPVLDNTDTTQKKGFIRRICG